MTQRNAMLETYDAIVVGAGVAGALVASKLAASAPTRGSRILVLEAGERGAGRDQLVSSWARSTDKSLGSPYVPSDPSKIPGPEQGPIPDAGQTYRDNYYDQPEVEKYQSTYERRVGGSTWHWLGHTPRLLPNDFRLRSFYGVGIDWPISYDDLEPWYCRAEQEIGVAGDHNTWNGLHGAFRSCDFPMTEVWPSWSDEVVMSAIDGLHVDGLPVKALSTPSARNTQPYNGRPPCGGNATCVPVCPIGAKYDATVHLARAEAAGVKIRERCIVDRLDVEPNGLVSAVRYRAWDGSAHEVRGRFVVLAANAIETAKLLLLSGPTIANTSKQVGCNLMDHLQKTVMALAPVPLFPFRGPPSTSGIEVFRDGPIRAQRSAFRLSLGNDGWTRKGAPLADVARLVDQGLFGAALREQLWAETTRQFRMSCSAEVLPDESNRVTLSKSLDSSGIPRPEIRFHAPEYTKAAFRPALYAIAAILDRLNATQRDFGANLFDYTGAGHVMGTCRMGRDPKASVVDADCIAHDHPNLYIVGGSTFPTCGTANPTLTIAALALRAADQLAGSLE
jgi:glucose dehydrogenase